MFKIKTKLCKYQMLEFLKRFTKRSIQVIVHDIWVGSIVVNCTIVCSEKDDTVSSELYAAILELQNGSYSIFDGQTVDVSTDSHRNSGPCEIYQMINGLCLNGYVCKAENTVPSCEQVTEKSRDYWALIGGLSAGGLLILLVSAMFVVLVKRITSSWKDTHNARQSRYPKHSPERGGKATSDISSIQNSYRGVVSDRERTLPAWGPGPTRSFMSNAHDHSRPFSSPYHIPRTKAKRPNKDWDNSFY